MGNPVFKEKQENKKMSFLRHVIRRSHLNSHFSRLGTSNHPLRSLLEDPLDSIAADADTRSSLDSNTAIDDSVDDFESILLDNINPRIINMSVEPEESPEEGRMGSLFRQLDFNDLFSSPSSDNFPSPSATRFGRSFYRWQSQRSTRPLSTRSSFVPSRIPRASMDSIFNRSAPIITHSQTNAANTDISDSQNNET